MNKLNQLLSVLLAVLLVLSLAACGKNQSGTDATDAKGQTVTVSLSDSVGSVMLIGEDYLTVHYDEDGKVVAVVNSDAEGVYTDLNGEACAKAISQLLKTADPPITNAYALIKHVRGSLVPDENFLQGIITEAKLALSEIPVIASAPEDQDDLGYFSAETAEAILAARLENPANATYASSSSPVDGYYKVSVTLENRIDNYTVGAYYGTVTQVIDDGEPRPEEEMPDYFVDDGTNMDYTDNPEA